MRGLQGLLPIDDIHRLRTAWGTCTASTPYTQADYIKGPLCCLSLSFNMTAVALSLSRHQHRPATSWSRFDELELPLPKR